MAIMVQKWIVSSTNCHAGPDHIPCIDAKKHPVFVRYTDLHLPFLRISQTVVEPDNTEKTYQ